ncbi:type II secretion system protein GspD [Flagellimonas meridianipacifica]|uniref:Type IV pilus assembly protein PilQ n=1 Tax=Flagellimonas meridianipacifica TaxID=1080225 RepID=A0A2T0MI03_9FLAO|nr:type II and III secretion system protein [Allomuricauda pacifica]PRX57207.1 type IV pilus assembly protein PilQ [Allomuricauda pacifica]
MKRYLVLIPLLLLFLSANSQEERIRSLRNNLEALAMDNPAYNETLKLEVNVSSVSLPNFLMAVSKVHQLNLSVSNDIANITIINNFSNVTISDLLLFLCKEYNLTIDFTGSILAIKSYRPTPVTPVEKVVQIGYDPNSGLISMDIGNDPLEKVFRKIIEVSGKNLLYSNGLKDRPLNILLNDVPFDTAMAKLADINGLVHSKSRDGFYLFSSLENGDQSANRNIGMGPGTRYEVLDTINRILNINLQNSPVAEIIDNLAQDLNLDVYTATPLEQAGTITFNAKGIYFDDLLAHIFESQETALPSVPQETLPSNGRARTSQIPRVGATSTNFTFKKENNIYFFGTADQLSLRNVEIIQMMYRSVELLGDPTYGSGGGRTAGRTARSDINFFGNNQNQFGQAGGLPQGNLNRRTLNTQGNFSFRNSQDGAQALVDIFPDEIKSQLDIKVDFELNSFIVSGPAANVQRFKGFLKEIDRPVPVVLIEVMILEVRKSATLETGISLGIGDAPVSTRGNLFPSADITLGANTVNRIIGGFDGFGSFNIGKVVPNFFATIRALENNGNLKIRSTPKLSTLNGHRATLSIGETTYYVITNQNFFGSQIPTASEIRNFAPVDAELSLSIRPFVSGDGQVTLDINVVQSDFSEDRIEDEAPPDLTSREFSSIIRMQNQDLAILGGLEEKIKNDTGSGVPLLARIPVIKWLFSRRQREDTKQKLTVLIKPTVIY